ncbi:Acg family FMN-binding oxidoreductase [Mycolicibacterium confluentis]|uniref:Acg family FMN-binding oxidoreductase n=1 Tax=Mycolicibacterium confluentis TaxID=28047 RepID=UPI000A16B860|nr:nitroreductase family protein [Mycolicibacterium confluentis]MCV7321687.1 nitroreductase family protein [Mycolicibacterium confluentis]ORV31971.1 NAD(P)H nitroreductase [Mycolicibacterium confluentis]
MNLPDEATVLAALALAQRAPSVHNTQPWLWRLGDEGVHLYADSTHHLPHIDPQRRDLILSCGAALQHFTVALAALGWQAHVHRMPNSANPDHLASIEISASTASEQDIALAAAIPRRRTDRRLYSSWPVPAGDIALMSSRAARSGVMLRRVAAPERLATVILEAMHRHADDTEYLIELSQWSGRYGALAGVPARNTPPAAPHSTLPARAFANPVLPQPEGAAPETDAGVVLALGTATDDPLAVLRAGEATGVVLLTATALGLSSCPITEPLEIAETRELVRTTVLDRDCIPQMLLRVGWAPLNADPLPATPRRPLTDVVSRLDGSPIVLS